MIKWILSCLVVLWISLSFGIHSYPQISSYSCSSLGKFKYHLAAKALEEGIGSVSSQTPCRYGNETAMNSNCPTSCKVLLVATWGDCYCKYPTYKPEVSTSSFLVNMTVQELFGLLATDVHFPAAICRDFLNEEDSKKSWGCIKKQISINE